MPTLGTSRCDRPNEIATSWASASSQVTCSTGLAPTRGKCPNHQHYNRIKDRIHEQPEPKRTKRKRDWIRPVIARARRVMVPRRPNSRAHGELPAIVESVLHHKRRQGEAPSIQHDGVTACAWIGNVGPIWDQVSWRHSEWRKVALIIVRPSRTDKRVHIVLRPCSMRDYTPVLGGGQRRTDWLPAAVRRTHGDRAQPGDGNGQSEAASDCANHSGQRYGALPVCTYSEHTFVAVVDA
jgi:hypothetical protein